MREFVVGVGAVACLLIARNGTSVAAAPPAGAAPAAERLNVVLIFTDDQGYGDLGCYGAENLRTPHIDSLARDGARMTNFYVAQAVCSSSRAALLTGCYSNRVGIVGALNQNDRHGIHADETTLAEVLKARGYATGVFGKWHLGHHPQFLPTRHGFDEFFGLPYSNDMGPARWDGKGYPDLPLFDGEQVVEKNPDMNGLTRRYTERAVRFIEKHAAEPFFLYVPHTMPHVPLGAGDDLRGKSPRGLFGDVIEEIDASVGKILAALDKHRLTDKTLVIFTCDNGPWLVYGDHAGSSGGLREGKGTTWDGGVRVPCLARLPGKIPAGHISHEPAMTIDLLPTIARLVGAESPRKKIDGLDIWPLLTGAKDARSPHEALYFYWLHELQAVRSGPWKLHLPHAYVHPIEFGAGGNPGKIEQRRTELVLFDLAADPAETTNVADKNPEVVARLQRLIEAARSELGDSATRRVGAGVREPGRLPLRKIGYLPTYRAGAVDKIAFQQLTDVICFSAGPRANGGFDPGRITPEFLAKVRRRAEPHGVSVSIALGGDGLSKDFAAVATDPAKRRRFVAELLAYCRQHQLHGADFDWEFPRDAAERKAYADLLIETKEAFRPHGLLVTVALGANWTAIEPRAHGALDRIHVMSYDHGGKHATYDQAVKDLNFWLVQQNVSPAKIALGVPFYGRRTTDRQAATYAEIVAAHHPSAEADEAGGYFFNGPATIRRKTDLARQRGLAGVMVWELGQDTFDGSSLLSTIDAAAGDKR